MSEVSQMVTFALTNFASYSFVGTNTGRFARFFAHMGIEFQT